jgi:Zn-dependent protease with chaperone function
MRATEFACRACGAHNRLGRDGLLQMSQSPTCGRCKGKLLPAYSEPLTRLDPRCYVHDLDRQALEALHQIPGIRTLLRTLLKKSAELQLRLYHTANYVKVTARQLPELRRLFERAAQLLGIQELPDLYVSQDPRVQASTYGVDRAVINVSSGAVDLMDERELLAVLAHELGHWQCQHVLYGTAALWMSKLASSLLVRMTLGLGNLAILPLQLALLRWYRAGELTADRAAMLAVREPVVVLRTLMKMAGGSQKIYERMDFQAFLAQADEFEEIKDEGLIGKGLYYWESLQETHPYPVWRASEVVRWVNEGPYLRILAGEYPQISVATQGACQVCGQPTQAGSPLCASCLEKEDEAGSAEPRGDPDRSDSAWDRTIQRFRQFFDS